MSERSEHALLLRRRAADWKAAGATGRKLDRQLALAMSPAQRLAQGAALVRVAGKLAPRSSRG